MSSSTGIRLHVGCGTNHLDGWENYDRELDLRKRLPFASGSCSRVFAEHVIEHLSYLEAVAFLRESWRVLERGGVLRVAFPDPSRLDKERAHQCAVLTSFGHRSAWTPNLMRRVLECCGFGSVSEKIYGGSHFADLQGIEGHHRVSRWAKIETSILEAIR